MTKILKQFTTTEKFVENNFLTITPQLLLNNENYQDLVYTTETVQDTAKAYYVQIKLPYNQYIPTAFIFKIRNTNVGVENINKLDFKNDTHQVIKYSEAPYNGENISQYINVISVGYLANNIQRYQTYTYNQLKNLVTGSFSEEYFNNIHENVQNIIQTYITENIDSNATNFKFNLQKLDTSNISGIENYITFDFIFISKISWNQFICCYDRNNHDQYIVGGRTLNGNNPNIFLKIYPFKENSDLITRSEDYGNNRIFHNSIGEIEKITLKVYDGTTPLSDIPFYINGQSIKIGPSKQYSLSTIPIYNFSLPNIDSNTCIIEYEYNDD